MFKILNTLTVILFAACSGLIKKAKPYMNSRLMRPGKTNGGHLLPRFVCSEKCGPARTHDGSTMMLQRSEGRVPRDRDCWERSYPQGL